MATDPADRFEGKPRDATAEPERYRGRMISTVISRRDWWILLTLAIIWGAAFFFIDVAVRHVPTFTYVWLRVSIAAGGLLLYLRWRGLSLRMRPGVWGAMLILALLNNVIPFALFGWGQTQIASGLASILNSTTPIWGVLVAHLFTTDERITPGKLAGVLFGFGGVAVMVGPGLLSDMGSELLAQLACLVAALLYALAGVFARRFRRIGIPPEQVATGQLTAAALVMLPVALVLERPWLQPVPPLSAWAAITALALICSAFAYILYFHLIASAGATNALLVTLLVPPTAIVLGVLFLGESMAPREFGGLALIALGLAAIDGRLLARARRAQPASAPQPEA
jgi:drug/metabolite transporter (DMT)-like permease